MPKNYLKALAQAEQNVNPLFNLLGARLTRADKGEAVITMPLSPALAQGMGFVAGGILATLADEAMAHAVITLLTDGQKVVTTEMNIRYLRSTDPNQPGELVAAGSVLKAGGTVLTTEARIHDSNGRLLATAGGSFFILRPKEI